MRRPIRLPESNYFETISTIRPSRDEDRKRVKDNFSSLADKFRRRIPLTDFDFALLADACERGYITFPEGGLPFWELARRRYAARFMARYARRFRSFKISLTTAADRMAQDGGFGLSETKLQNIAEGRDRTCLVSPHGCAVVLGNPEKQFENEETSTDGDNDE